MIIWDKKITNTVPTEKLVNTKTNTVQTNNNGYIEKKKKKKKKKKTETVQIENLGKENQYCTN
jgi:hypothetical protein